jgi:hypothetical protein
LDSSANRTLTAPTAIAPIQNTSLRRHCRIDSKRFADITIEANILSWAVVRFGTVPICAKIAIFTPYGKLCQLD